MSRANAADRNYGRASDRLVGDAPELASVPEIRTRRI
jgi:hypothetical protein